MKHVRTIFSLLGAVACAASARADLTMTLVPSPVQNTPRGQEVVFSGTLTNTSVTDKLYLNDIQATLSATVSPYLTLGSNSFFSNVPGVLLPNESYSNSELFRVSLSALAAPGDYPGTINLIGGANILATTTLASAGFVVSSPWKIVSVTQMANGHLLLQCVGLSNVANTIQSSPDQVTPFSTLTAVTADGAGAFQYEDANPGSQKFYRLSFP